MKQFSFFLALCLTLLGAQNSIAQGDFTGYIIYEMEAVGTMAPQMNGGLTKIAFRDGMGVTITDMEQMSMRMVTNKGASDGLLLMAIPSMKKQMAVRMSGEEIQENMNNSLASQREGKIFYYKKEIKKIAGYPCYRAMIRMEEFAEPITVWVTDEIKPDGLSQLQIQFPELEGFPLMYSMVQNNTTMTMKAVEVSTNPPALADFSMEIPKGFEEMNMGDMLQTGMKSDLFGNESRKGVPKEGMQEDN